MTVTGASVKFDHIDAMLKAMRRLQDNRLMVGIPSTAKPRDDDDTTSPLNNAQLGYLHEHGSPSQHIPARPWLRPGAVKAQEAVIAILRLGAQGILEGRVDAGDKALAAAGMKARDTVKAYVVAGVPPPLAESTLERRAAMAQPGKGRTGRKGALLELARRAAGHAPGLGLSKPLIDTGQLLNSVTYVIRKTPA